MNLWQIKNKYDWLAHFLLCFLITLILDYRLAIIVALTIELTQAEYDCPDIKEFLKRLISKDIMKDLIFDGLGILIAIYIKGII